MNYAMRFTRLFWLDFRELTYSPWFYAVMGLFSLIAVSFFATGFRPENVHIAVWQPSSARDFRLSEALETHGVKSTEAEKLELALRQLQKGRFSAVVEVRPNRAAVLHTATVLDRDYLHDLLRDALRERHIDALLRTVRRVRLPEPVLHVSSMLRPERRPAVVVTATNRSLNCLWLVSAVIGVISWLLTGDLYDRLIESYSATELLTAKVAACFAAAAVPWSFGWIATAAASRGAHRAMLSFAVCGLLAMLLGVLAGIAVGAVPLAFGGAFKAVAFAGIMGTSMVFLGLWMLGGAANTVATMFPPIRWIARWNPLYQINQLNQILIGYTTPVRADHVADVVGRSAFLLAGLAVLCWALQLARNRGGAWLARLAGQTG